MIILLDIDGVLVPANSWRKPDFLEDGFPAFTQWSVMALRKVLSETDAFILLTTSHKTSYSIDQWYDIFRLRGIMYREIQRLDSNSIDTNRKDEILQWYQTNDNHGEQYVIIDDDKMLNDLPDDIKDHLVLTSASVGLTEEDADKAIAILTK